MSEKTTRFLSVAILVLLFVLVLGLIIGFPPILNPINQKQLRPSQVDARECQSRHPDYYWAGAYEGNNLSSIEGELIVGICSNFPQTATVDSPTGMVNWVICAPADGSAQFLHDSFDWRTVESANCHQLPFVFPGDTFTIRLGP